MENLGIFVVPTEQDMKPVLNDPNALLDPYNGLWEKKVNMEGEVTLKQIGILSIPEVSGDLSLEQIQHIPVSKKFVLK